jgi:hypothetical protein
MLRQKRVSLFYVDVDEMTTLEMTRQALAVQDKTKDATSRTKAILDETKQV